MSENVANRALKARAKAAADRIQQDINNTKVIRNSVVHSNDFLHLAESDDLSGNISVPLSFWLKNKQAVLDRDGPVAVQIASNEMPEILADDLPDIEIIVLPFVNFVDGRSYSHAHKLRLRYAFKGEIRAVGDVNFDQLDFLKRAGCDAFELRENADYETALRAFSEFSEVYQPAADNRHLIFSRRRKVH